MKIKQTLYLDMQEERVCFMLVHRCHRNRPLAVEHFRHIEEIAQMIFRRIRLRRS